MTHAQAASDAARHAPLPVAGYREQSRLRVDVVNELKEMEERVLRLLSKIERYDFEEGLVGIDGRWLALGRTHIQQGFMAAARAVFQPGRVKLPEDNATKENHNG